MNRIHFPSIDSTHDYAIQNGRNFPHWTVVTADFQTSGRGRGNRSWISPPGSGLLCSIVIREPLQAAQLASIIHVMTVSVAGFIESCGMTPEIIWPNDVLVGAKKIAGVMAQSVAGGGVSDLAVLSAGININHDMEALRAIDRPATSIFVETGIRHGAQELLPQFLNCCKKFYHIFKKEGFAPIMELWRKWEMLTGKRVIFDSGTDLIGGTVAGFDDDCAIRIADMAGSIRTFHSGEINRLVITNT